MRALSLISMFLTLVLRILLIILRLRLCLCLLRADGIFFFGCFASSSFGIGCFLMVVCGTIFIDEYAIFRLER